jgi:hypothetical protein
MRIDAAIVADIAKAAAAAALSNVTKPRTAAMLAPLLELLQTSGVEVLSAASMMEFELLYPESVPAHARQTMRAQLKGEMRAQAMRTLNAQAEALAAFQVQCMSVTLNAIGDQMMGRQRKTALAGRHAEQRQPVAEHRPAIERQSRGSARNDDGQ